MMWRAIPFWLLGVSFAWAKLPRDAAGNLRATLYPATSNVFTYDADNRLQSMSNAFGATTFGYTGASQLAVESGPGGTVNYTYNQGRRSTLSLGSWSQSYNYDNAWRLTGISSPAGAFNYAYASTPSPQPEGIQLPNGATISYGYDTLARLTGAALANYWGQIVDGEVCGRDALGLPTNIVRWLGMTTNNVTPTYDSLAQVIGWSGAENGTNRLNEQLKYQYDAAGNLVTRTNNALVQSFTINALNEISSATRSGSFAFTGALPEPASKITVNGTTAIQYTDLTFAAPGLSLANGANTFTVVATNKYGIGASNSTTANLPTTVNFQCDTNGNLTSDGLRTFQYDSENQLTNVFVASQWQVGFIYDSLGRRRIEQYFTWSGSSWSKTSEVHFVYDELVPIQELDSNNNVLVTYTRGLDLSLSRTGAGGIGGLLARTDVNGSTFYHSDLNGNVTSLMDQSQHVVARYEYDPFGRFINKQGGMGDANRYGFSSKERVSPANLYYYGARFYDPNLQRWLNRDPIGEAGGINLYRFNRNKPVNFIDPWGLTTYVWPPEYTPPGVYSPTATVVNDGSTAVLPAVPYLTDSQGLQSTDLDFLPAFLPEIPAVGKALDAAGDALGNLAKDALDNMGLGKPKVPKPAINCPNGTKVTGFTGHGVDRAIGDAAKRAGTTPQAILDALKNPQKIVSGVDSQGRPYQIFTGQDARVVVNPQTGNVVSVNPLSGAGASQ